MRPNKTEIFWKAKNLNIAIEKIVIGYIIIAGRII